MFVDGSLYLPQTHTHTHFKIIGYSCKTQAVGWIQMGWKEVCLGAARLAMPLAAALIPPHVKQFHDNSLTFPTQANDKHAGIWEV